MDMKQAIKAAGVAAPSPGASFFDAAGNLRLEFVDKQHMDPLARQLQNDGLTMSQLRRFFNHCRGIERRLRSHETLWEHEHGHVAKLSAYAADALAKKKIPASFRQFIDNNVARTQTGTDFVEGLMEHFEALVGFAALYLKEERTR